MSARILIIEDNPANLELMTYLLSAYGHRVFAAESGREGLEIAAREWPDLIVCDVQLPDIDGFEIARWLKSHPQLRAIPLVAVTALAMVGDRDRALSAGCDGYLPKPIDPEIFLRQMESFLSPIHHTATPRCPTAESVPARVVPRNRRTILAVDNLQVNLELARSIFEPSGYKVVTAESMDEGLEIARTTTCDLILSDVCMSEGTGYDFLEAVKNDARIRTVPVVLITSTMIDKDDRAKGLELGAARVLRRPIDPEVLLSEIQCCLVEKGID